MGMPVAIVGCGYWGPNLIRNFFSSPLYRVSMVVDRDPDRLARIRALFPGVPTSTDFGDALAPETVLVVLATPPETHHPLGLAALSAGKHLLIEKPMALSSAHCRELNALAEGKGLRIFVDHTFLFTPAVRYIRDFIREGRLGDLRYLDSTRINLGMFQSKVNVVWDLAPHDFSIVDFLVGGFPERIDAAGAGHLDPRNEDIAFVTFSYPGALLCHFNFNWLSPVKIRRMILGGSSRMLIYDDTEPTEKIRIYDHGAELKAGDKHAALVDYRTGDILIPKLPQQEALGRLAEHVWRALEEGEPTPVDGKDGERIVRLVEAAQASLRGGAGPEASADWKPAGATARAARPV
jgi:predicted dehydrogenase